MANRADINSWIGRFIMWDGMLPFTTWAVPLLIHWLIPNNRAAIELTAVALPIAAFFLRYRSGRPHIASNDCHAVVKRFQVAAFCLGIFVLVLIDAVLVLSYLMPNGATVASTHDLVIWASLHATYLTAMAFAMHPGFCGHASLTTPCLRSKRSRFGGWDIRRLDRNCCPDDHKSQQSPQHRLRKFR